MDKPNSEPIAALFVKTELIARKKVLGRDGKYHYTTTRRVVRNKKITDAFVADIVDVLQGTAGPLGTVDDYKYHHSGEGVTAENAADTGLGTPREDARVVGTQIEGATANIYKSVATITYTDTWAITEHGLFNSAGAGGPPVTGGTLMDRTVFAAINVVSGNQIEFTFQITLTSGG